MQDVLELLQKCGIQPTPQRLAVAKFVLFTDTHPTAEDVLSKVLPGCPTLSKATVYNTLNLLAERGLLKTQNIREDAVVFDAKTERHHHFIDDKTGRIYDIPLEAVDIQSHESLDGFEILEYQVTLRGRLKKRSR
jgi:Fe2+ or Zn2+ uptake regulation protein